MPKLVALHTKRLQLENRRQLSVRSNGAAAAIVRARDPLARRSDRRRPTKLRHSLATLQRSRCPRAGVYSQDWSTCTWITSNTRTAGEWQITSSATSPADCITLAQSNNSCDIANIQSTGAGSCWCQFGTPSDDGSAFWRSCHLSTGLVSISPPSPPSGPGSSSDTDLGIIIGAAVGGVLLIAGIGLAIFFLTNSSKKSISPSS